MRTVQSVEPQRPVDGALRFLPARQLFEIRHPPLEVRMILQRQALRFIPLRLLDAGRVWQNGDRYFCRVWVDEPGCNEAAGRGGEATSGD